MGIQERWIGGAGTGKTRLIEAKLTQAREELGLDTDEVGLCTFTRAGRQELSERVAASWGVDVEALTKHGWFRTAHSIAFRQSGVEEGALIEGKDGAEWTGHAIGARISISQGRGGDVEYEATDGDRDAAISLQAWELARQTLRPLAGVIEDQRKLGDESVTLSTARAFVEKYERAKAREGRLDFTDVVSRFAGVKNTIEGPVETDPIGEVPERLRVLAIDEAQDSSAVVDRICRRLAASPSMERVFLVGDIFQCIFGFGGSDYRNFTSWDAHEEIMPQSYRCPANVMALGERCLRQMKRGYRDRKIKPAPHRGTIREASTAEEAVGRIDPSRSTLILARCAFSLAEYEASLKERKIPFSWIDKVHGESTLSGYKALWDLEHGQIVSGEDWSHAIAMIAVASKSLGKLLHHGEKTAWKQGKRSNVDFVLPTPEIMSIAGCTETLSHLILAGKWPSALEDKHAAKAADWRAAAVAHGVDVASNPRVRLSTIHSAKGCEADDVILSTISSRAVENARLALDERHDEECRVNYVAVTRTRENLIVVGDGRQHRLEIPI